jgi:hypothetical protein
MAEIDRADCSPRAPMMKAAQEPATRLPHSGSRLRNRRHFGLRFEEYVSALLPNRGGVISLPGSVMLVACVIALSPGQGRQAWLFFCSEHA